MAKAKTTKPKTPVKKSTEKDNLAKELKSLISKLDEEGLAFLVKQAHVHLYNMQVDALNQTMIKDAQRKSTARAKKTVKTKETGFGKIKMSESGSNCHIYCGNQWISFTGREITSMVKIAFGEGSDLEIRDRLYTWLARERSDLLSVASIANKFDDKLTTLISLLKKNFKINKK
jgi:hypothetical protein